MTAMQANNIKSSAELSRRAGVSQGQIGKLLNFKMSPVNSKGDWRRITCSVCKALNSLPEDIFPEHMHHDVPTNVAVAFVDSACLAAVPQRQIGPGEACAQTDTHRVLDEVLQTLTDRERDVLRARFWEGKTMAEVARKHHVTHGAISETERRALRKLRHPSRMKVIETEYTINKGDTK